MLAHWKSGPRVRAVLVAFVAGLALVLPVGGALAQDATPTGEEQEWLAFKPDPSLCMTEPRPIEDFEAQMGLTWEATPSVFLEPEGAPADQEIVDAVIQTAIEWAACTNAGKFGALSGFYTDAGFAEDHVGIDADTIAFLTAEHDPLPVENRISVVDVLNVQVLDDGRVGAIVIFSGNDDYWILAEEDGRYLIDHFVDEFDMPVEATPAA